MAEEKNRNKQEQPVEEVKETVEQSREEISAEEEIAGEEQVPAEEDLQEQIGKLEAERDDVKDKYLRLQAEFDNFRKRTLKEKMELMKSGGESVLRSILPVVDDLDRALAAFKEVADDDPHKQGVVLISNKFQDFLKQNGVQEIESLGKDFDTDLHEAITKIPAPEDRLKGKVVDVVQKGYLLHDKVIRFAKVVIGE